MTRILLLGISIFSFILSSCTQYFSCGDEIGLSELKATLVNKKSISNNDLQKTLFGSIKGGDYLSPLLNLINSEEELLQNFPASMYFQSLATSLSCVGEYKTVLEAWDMQSKKVDANIIKTQIPTSSLQAKKEIITIARKQKVIMINEAHHIPLHRIFTTSLLPELYDLGFRHLAIETLNQYDIERLHQDNVPTLKTGSYVAEPQYANMIRTALELGYQLVAYEAEGGFNRSQRDSCQAKNLTSIFESDPSAKMIVHAGFGHIYESTSNDWIKMGQYFKKFSNIDPFTIDQVILTEKSKRHYEHQFYDTLIKSSNLIEPTVFKSSETKYWTTPDQEKLVDMQIVHPRSSCEKGRSNWLNKIKVEVPKNYIEIQSPILIQAFNVNETNHENINDLIPVDQFLITNKQKKYFLNLIKGNYLIRLLNRDNSIATSYQIRV